MHNCLEAADIIGAMSLEALTGTKAPFDERLHALRPYAGNKLVAQRLRLLLNESEIMQSHMDCGGCRILILALHAAGAWCHRECLAAFKRAD